MITNKQNITIEIIAKHYQPVLWDTCDKISNCSDQIVGYYAYLLQQELIKVQPHSVWDCNKNSLQYSPLSLVKFPMRNIKINDNSFELNFAKDKLEHLKDEEYRKLIRKEFDNEEKFLKWEEEIIESAKNPTIVHNFELFFQVDTGGLLKAILLRNGFLLMCLKDAGIKNFDELEQYEAVMVYDNAPVNADFCAFVKFEKL